MMKDNFCEFTYDMS